jgi:hypothetical protein
LISGGALSFMILGFSLLFSLVCCFLSLLLVLRFVLLLDDPLELFLAFWSSSYASWGFGFKLCSFLVNGLIKREIEKPSG